MGIFAWGALSMGVQAAIEWSGSGRVYHQRWSFGDGETSTDRNREKLDFYINGASQLSDNVSAQVRFRYYTFDFQDKVDEFHLNKANLTWNYGEGSFFKIGKIGVVDKNVGEHIRAYYNNRLGMAWRHYMGIGPGNIFLGFSRFLLGDSAGQPLTDHTAYYTPQLGYEMRMGDYHVLLGGTYHLYSSLTPNDFNNGYVVLGREGEERGDYAGIEFFGKVMGRLGELGWHAKYAMFSNGEAPEGAMDEDKSVALMGFGLDYGRVALMVEMNNSGTYAVNRAIVNKDWCGYNASKVDEKRIDSPIIGKSTCDATKLTATYKLSENLMPSLEFVQSERNNDGLSQRVLDDNESLKDEKFMMTRLSLNFMF